MSTNKGTTSTPALTKKTTGAKKTAAPAPAKKTASLPARKTPAKVPAKTAAERTATSPTSHELMLARVESVRLAQRTGGHFDCFGRAQNGYCDQGGCAYHAECLSVSGLLHGV